MRRRRVGWLLVLLVFIGLPILEIYVIIQVGQVIGPWWTILLLIGDSVFGSWLLRREGSKAWRALRLALTEGRMPAKELADGVLVVLGGSLMISPGFVTDVFGMLAILPLTRPLCRALLARLIARRLPVAGAARFGPGYGPGAGPGTGFGPGFTPGFGPAPGQTQSPGPDVVRGDVIDPEGTDG